MSKEKKVVTGAPAKKKNNTLSLFKNRRLSTSGKEPDLIKSDSFEFGAGNAGETVDGSLSKKENAPSKAFEVGPSTTVERHSGKRREITDVPDAPPRKSGNFGGGWLLSGKGRNSESNEGRLSAISQGGSSVGGRASMGRKSSLKMDAVDPYMLNHLDIQMSDALITMLDEPSLLGTGTLAAERRTPAYAVALKANEDAILSLSSILGEESPEIIQRKIDTADIYKGLGK